MKQFTLEYWTDDGWFVGRLKEMPAVMSQGATLEELQRMIRDAYRLMVEDAADLDRPDADVDLTGFEAKIILAESFVSPS